MIKRRPVLILFLALLLSGCAAIGKLNTSAVGVKAIESRKPLDLAQACVEYAFFTDNIKRQSWPDPNEAIAAKIESLASSSQENGETAAAGTFSSRKDVFLYLREEYGLSFAPSKSSYDNFLILADGGKLFYITFNKSYSLYAFSFAPNQEELQRYSNLTALYEMNEKAIKANESRISSCRNPTIEKTRQVPYTAYRRVKKSRNVTKYRTVKASSGSYQEPYAARETYYENEPYTAYRTEKYLSPNPDYNPSRADELEAENSRLKASLSSQKREIESCIGLFVQSSLMNL